MSQVSHRRRSVTKSLSALALVRQSGRVGAESSSLLQSRIDFSRCLGRKTETARVFTGLPRKMGQGQLVGHRAACLVQNVLIATAGKSVASMIAGCPIVW
jgi:hypothetical protein